MASSSANTRLVGRVRDWPRLALLIASVFLSTPSHAALSVAVLSDNDELAWQAARRWAEASGSQLEIERVRTAHDDADIVVFPLHDFADTVPEAAVLELPFLYPNVESVRRAFDGELGRALKEAAARAGWQGLALWDAGMEAMSGNQAYNRVANLAGIRFVLLRPDSIAERELRALDAWTRVVRPASVAALAQECLVDSRSATLAQLQHEQINRVHLNLTLTHHRYNGWVVAARAARWKALPPDQRARLRELLADITRWEQEQAHQREQTALEDLQRQGMEITPLPSEQWSEFARRMPWEAMLPTTLTADAKRRLLRLATAVRIPGANVGPKERSEPAPYAPHREPEQQ